MDESDKNREAPGQGASRKGGCRLRGGSFCFLCADDQPGHQGDADGQGSYGTYSVRIDESQGDEQVALVQNGDYLAQFDRQGGLFGHDVDHDAVRNGRDRDLSGGFRAVQDAFPQLSQAGEVSALDIVHDILPCIFGSVPNEECRDIADQVGEDR